MNLDFKHAQTDWPVLPIVRQRWSPRAFSQRSVEPEKLLSCLEAARWTPSSSNQQPWSFIVARKEEPAEFQKMLACLRDGNIAWAQHAPVLMVTVGQREFDSGRPNNHMRYDVGQAAAFFSLQATELGLYVHQMAGIYPDKIRESYQIPETHEPITALALGYLGDPDDLSEQYRERELAPRTRKLLHEFVFAEDWGQPAPLVAAD
jgi:nitroreductase